MPPEALTEEQVTQSEMDKFSGGSTTDGEPSDGEATEDENARLAEATAERDAAAEVAAQNEATRLAAEAKAATAPPADETPEAKATREAAEAAEAAKPGKKSVQERINTLTRGQREAERTRDIALARVAELEGKKPLTTPADATTAALVAPDPKDFEFGELDTKYISALARFEVRQELAADRKVVDDKRLTEAQVAAVAEFQERVDTFAEQGVVKFPDFNDLVIEGAKAGDWDLTATVGELILGSDYGHEIAHFLASDPEESRRIAALPPSAQAAKFGRLEAKFEAEAAAKDPAQPPKVEAKVSKAPPPLKTPRSQAGQFQVDGSTKDFAAFEALAKSG